MGPVGPWKPVGPVGLRRVLSISLLVTYGRIIPKVVMGRMSDTGMAVRDVWADALDSHARVGEETSLTLI